MKIFPGRLAMHGLESAQAALNFPLPAINRRYQFRVGIVYPATPTRSPH